MDVKDMTFDFVETESQQLELQECIGKLQGQQGTEMQALQDAQRIYGYLPIEVLERISKALQIPLEELYSTATFYAQFTFVPKGKYTVSVCMGTACYVKGAGDIMDSIETQLKIKPGETTSDRKFTLESCRCIGACGLAPVIKVNEEVYGRLTKKKSEKIITTYIKGE